jgi:general stress protein YciG
MKETVGMETTGRIADNPHQTESLRMSREEAGRLGGDAVIKKYGSGYMKEIGKSGGQKVSSNREHMAEIGRKGGKVSRRT